MAVNFYGPRLVNTEVWKYCIFAWSVITDYGSVDSFLQVQRLDSYFARLVNWNYWPQDLNAQYLSGFCTYLFFYFPESSSAEIQETNKVVSGHSACSLIGEDVMTLGGNAVDAAVATTVCMALMEPHITGLVSLKYQFYS